MPKQHFQLTPEDRDTLTSPKASKARRYKRALGLLEIDRGKTYTAVAHTLGMIHQTLCTWAKKDHALGLACLKDAPRPGRPVAITGKQRAPITALACSTPPQGYGKWTLRLLADRCVELGSCDRLSHTHVQTILKKTSWLNMIEIEFSALARGCLNRRIATKAHLRREVLAFFQDRAAKRILLNWQFTLPKARDKMNAHYQRVSPHNQNLK